MATRPDNAITNGATDSHSPIDVLLVGLGSVGSIYAYLLERSGRVRVTAVARSNYDLFAKEGVTIRTDKYGDTFNWRPHRVVKSQSDALQPTLSTHYTFCLLCTKSLPDVLPTTTLLSPAIAAAKVGQIGAFSLIQNGLGVERALYDAVKDAGVPVIGGLAWIGIMSHGGGAEVVWRGADTLVSGIYPPLPRPDSNTKTPVAPEAIVNTSLMPHRRSFTARELEAAELWRDVLKEGGANVGLTDHVDQVRYAKNIWNAAWSSIQALSRTYPATFALLPANQTEPLRGLIREIIDVGFAAGLLRQGDMQYNLGKTMGGPDEVAGECWDLITKMSLDKIRAGQQPHKMSLWVDVENDRPIEVEVIVAEVVKLARENGVEVPRLELVLALMKGLQASILERRAASAASAASAESARPAQSVEIE